MSQYRWSRTGWRPKPETGLATFKRGGSVVCRRASIEEVQLAWAAGETVLLHVVHDDRPLVLTGAGVLLDEKDRRTIHISRGSCRPA